MLLVFSRHPKALQIHLNFRYNLKLFDARLLRNILQKNIILICDIFKIIKISNNRNVFSARRTFVAFFDRMFQCFIF